MESSNMKNMVMLKNLPSNIIEEAIIIFKEPQTVKEKELIEKRNKINISETQTKSKDYILKEAEMLVSKYISDIENKKQEEKSFKQKYKRLKRYSIISTIILTVSLIINFI